MHTIKPVSSQSTPGNTVYRGEIPCLDMDDAIAVAQVSTQPTLPVDVFENDTRVARVHHDGGIDRFVTN
jgi:hypothetical protein